MRTLALRQHAATLHEREVNHEAPANLHVALTLARYPWRCGYRYGCAVVSSIRHPHSRTSARRLHHAHCQWLQDDRCAVFGDVHSCRLHPQAP